MFVSLSLCLCKGLMNACAGICNIIMCIFTFTRLTLFYACCMLILQSHAPAISQSQRDLGTSGTCIRMRILGGGFQKIQDSLLLGTELCVRCDAWNKRACGGIVSVWYCARDLISRPWWVYECLLENIGQKVSTCWKTWMRVLWKICASVSNLGLF